MPSFHSALYSSRTLDIPPNIEYNLQYMEQPIPRGAEPPNIVYTKEKTMKTSKKLLALLLALALFALCACSSEPAKDEDAEAVAAVATKFMQAYMLHDEATVAECVQSKVLDSITLFYYSDVTACTATAYGAEPVEAAELSRWNTQLGLSLEEMQLVVMRLSVDLRGKTYNGLCSVYVGKTADGWSVIDGETFDLGEEFEHDFYGDIDYWGY